MSFKLMSAMETNFQGVRNVPDLGSMGFTKAPYVGYRGSFVDSKDLNHPNEVLTRRTARAAQEANKLLVVDIEHWPLDPKIQDVQLEINLDKYIQVVEWARDECPGLRCGYYGHMPQRNYWDVVTYLKSKRAIEDGTATQQQVESLQANKTHYDQWKSFNARLRRGRQGAYIARGLGDVVDFVAPSLYTFYDDNLDWSLWAINMLKEARRYQKSVYAFLWPQYHDSGPKRGKMIDYETWYRQLEICSRYADGVIIWGHGGGTKETNPMWEFDKNWSWWKATKDFIIAKGIKV